MSIFPLENWNVPSFLGFETQKLGQFRLNQDGWQVSVLKVITQCNKNGEEGCVKTLRTPA